MRARCTRQFIVYLATWTFQNIQNYLYKLSGKRLSGKVIVRETSCTGNNRQVRARSCPGNVFPGNVCPGKWLSGKRLVGEMSCPGNVLSGNRLVRERSCPGNVLSGKRLSGKVIVRETSCTGNNRQVIGTHGVVRETSCPGNVCPRKWLSGKRPLPALSTSFLLNHAPNTPYSWTHWLQDLGVIQQREYESWVKKIEEIKQLVEFRQCTNTALGENAIFAFLRFTM